MCADMFCFVPTALQYRRSVNLVRALGPQFNYSVNVIFHDRSLHPAYGDAKVRLQSSGMVRTSSSTTGLSTRPMGMPR